MLFGHREQKEEKRENSKLLPLIYRVPLVGIRRAKSKSSYTRRGYTWVLKRRDFNENPKEKISRNQIFGIKRCS